MLQRLRTGAVKAHELRTFGKAELTAQLAELRTELQAVSTVIVYCFKLLVVVLGIEWQVLTDGKCKHCRTSILGQKKVAWVLVCCTVSVRWPWGVDPIGSSWNGWIGSHRSGSNPIQSNPIGSNPTQSKRIGPDRSASYPGVMRDEWPSCVGVVVFLVPLFRMFERCRLPPFPGCAATWIAAAA